jgi:hypothetical protein
VRVLADFHHHALAESLAILFEDRAGGELYFPIGMEWFEDGIWNFERKFHGDAVARQYLVGIWHDAVEVTPGVWRRFDPRHPGRIQHGVTLETAMNSDWDLVVSTLPPNDVGLHYIAKKAGAKFAIQVGNNHQVSEWHLADLILSSSTLPEYGLVHPGTWGQVQTGPGGKPTIVYHQEFSLEYFWFQYPPLSHRIESFVNCFPEGPSYPDFLAFAKGNRDFEFRVNGATGRPSWFTEDRPYSDEFTGVDINEVPDVARAMQDARVIWHTKHWSDGFGHVIHNAFAVGRPVIGYARYYQDKLAGPLWQEGKTSFNIEGMPDRELASLLHRLVNDDEFHREVSTNAAVAFRNLVDFDGEADAILRALA